MQEDVLDTNEALLPFVIDIPHNDVIRTQNRVITQVLQKKTRASYDNRIIV
jgi:hypothetical protein